MEKMTREKAEEMLREWQHRLGLDLWRISFEDAVPEDTMIVEGSVGCVSYDKTDMQAIVQMLREDDLPPGPFARDYEKTLVHELMHIKLAIFDDSGDAVHDTVVHMLVEEFARILVDLKRGVGLC